MTDILESMRRIFVPIHKEGYPFILIALFATIVLAWLWSPLGWIGTILTVWVCYFSRDPPRVTPLREGLVVSPADGRVNLITTAVPPAELDLPPEPMTRISVFMNVFDCHVNRAPVNRPPPRGHPRRHLSPPFPPPPNEPRQRLFKPVPFRVIVPNIITLIALCLGLTAIRLAFEGRYEPAVIAIVVAALLDGIDGRVARMLKGTSRFGAELDSLADFVNFGVAPALILYFWGLHELKSAGWIAGMVFAISTGLRLARFNVMVDDPNRPPWAGNFFVGMPAPGGAISSLLPLYLQFLGVLS